MDTISEIQEEKPSLPFNASLDPSNPLGLLEKVLDFIGKESDFLLKDTAEKEIATAVTASMKRLREATKDEEEKEKESLKPTEPMEAEKFKGKENVILGEVPNKGNGLDLETYSWTQTRKDVTITIPVPSGTLPRYVSCKFDRYRLKVCLNGSHRIIDGSLFDAVEPRDCFWNLYENAIRVLLTKQQKYEWWKYCVKGEPEIDTQKVKPGLDDYTF